MQERTFSYLNFPISLLRDFDGCKTLKNIFRYGAYYAYMKIGNRDEVCTCLELNLSNEEWDEAKELFQNTDRSLSPLTSIQKDIIVRHMEQYESVQDWIELLFFLALRSINKKSAHTNKAMIRARMMGYATPQECQEWLDEGHKLTDIQQKVLYMIAHQRIFDKVRCNAAVKFGISFTTKRRMIAFSFIREAEEAKPKTAVRIQMHKESERSNDAIRGNKYESPNERQTREREEYTALLNQSIIQNLQSIGNESTDTAEVIPF